MGIFYNSFFFFSFNHFQEQKVIQFLIFKKLKKALQYLYIQLRETNGPSSLCSSAHSMPPLSKPFLLELNLTHYLPNVNYCLNFNHIHESSFGLVCLGPVLNIEEINKEKKNFSQYKFKLDKMTLRWELFCSHGYRLKVIKITST